jgi:hypothetical protein
VSQDDHDLSFRSGLDFPLSVFRNEIMPAKARADYGYQEDLLRQANDGLDALQALCAPLGIAGEPTVGIPVSLNRDFGEFEVLLPLNAITRPDELKALSQSLNPDSPIRRRAWDSANSIAGLLTDILNDERFAIEVALLNPHMVAPSVIDFVVHVRDYSGEDRLTPEDVEKLTRGGHAIGLDISPVNRTDPTGGVLRLTANTALTAELTKRLEWGSAVASATE